MIQKKSLQWIAWVLIMPVLVLRGFTTIYPIVKTVLNSFFDIRILSGVNEFAGLSNYINIFKDQKVITTLKFTAIFVVVSMLFHIVFGIGLALILNMKFKGRRFLRTIVLIPWAMPSVVIGMAGKWAFNNDYGLINDFIRRFFPDFQLSWLINTGSARAAVIALDLWKDLPFFAIYNVIDYCSQTQAVYDHLWNCSYPINELLHSFLDLFTGVKKYVVYY